MTKRVGESVRINDELQRLIKDVTITAPNDGDVLAYDGATNKWINSNNAPVNIELDDLTDVTIAGVADNNVLQYNVGLGIWENRIDLTLDGDVTITSGSILFNPATTYIESTNADHLDLYADTSIDLNQDTFIDGDVEAEDAVFESLRVEDGTGTTTVTTSSAVIADGAGTFTASGAGSFVQGSADFPCYLEATGVGSVAQGNIEVGGYITASGIGSHASGSVNYANIFVNGEGAFANGYVSYNTTGGGIGTPSKGGFATGFSKYESSISAGQGGFTSGNAENFGYINSSTGGMASGKAIGQGTYPYALYYGQAGIAAGQGAFSQGYSGILGSISSTNEGAFTQGYAKGYNGPGGAAYASINATQEGSFARGRSLAPTPNYSSGIVASADGATAFGNVSATTVNSYITASGLGSMAVGSAVDGTIAATAANSFQFGVGTNNVANSLQVGATVRLEGTDHKVVLKDNNSYIYHDGTSLHLKDDDLIKFSLSATEYLKLDTWLFVGIVPIPELSFGSALNFGSIKDSLCIRGDLGSPNLIFTNSTGTIIRQIVWNPGTQNLSITGNTGGITVVDDFNIDSNSKALVLGDSQSAKLYYNGTNLIINPQAVGTGNVVIGVGKANTDYRLTFDGETNDGVLTWMEDEDYFQWGDFVFHQPMYKDINVGSYTLSGPPGLQPGVTNFLDEAGSDTGIYTYGMAVGEALSGSFELQHDYKEGTNLVFHVHWQGKDAPTGTDNVQFQLKYTVASDNTTLDAITTIVTGDKTFDTQYKSVRSDFPAITGTSLKIGDQILFTLTRIASDGDAYAGEALLQTLGIHYQVNSLGSRQILLK